MHNAGAIEAKWETLTYCERKPRLAKKNVYNGSSIADVEKSCHRSGSLIKLCKSVPPTIHKEARPLITVRVDFYVPEKTEPFARVRIVLLTAGTFAFRLTNCHPLYSFSPKSTPRYEFRKPLSTNRFTEIQKYPLPPESHETGEGRWKPFIAATSQANIHKVTGSARVRLRFPPIRKQVHFNAEGQRNGHAIGE
jgi:hypothetical protein